VYSAVTQFDNTNTSNDSAPFDGAGSGVIFGLVSFACGGLRFDSLGVPLLFLGRGGPRVLKYYFSIECYKVDPIRDPGLDREQTSKNVSPTI
jgi:hypothetical protein